MIVILSPAKTMDFSDSPLNTYTNPEFSKEAGNLAGILQKKSKGELAKLMSISDDLARKTYNQFQEFNEPETAEQAKQAILAYNGDVYGVLDKNNYTREEFAFAQAHVRIISGLYGILKPLDLIKPYRLEMKTALENPKGNNLYKFWTDTATHHLNQALESSGNRVLVNLASKEYSKIIAPKQLSADLITPVFKEIRGKELKTIGLYAKQARGLMTDYIIKHKINNPEQLKEFSSENYQYSNEHSSNHEWVFIR